MKMWNKPCVCQRGGGGGLMVHVLTTTCKLFIPLLSFQTMEEHFNYPFNIFHRTEINRKHDNNLLFTGVKIK